MTSYYKLFQAIIYFLFSTGISGQEININKLKTTDGYISGIISDSGVKIFKGIPFAAPPVGNLRWKEPQPIKKWTGIRKCDTFGANPIQVAPVPFDVYTAEFLIPANEPISEDCLYLNVWTTANTTNEKQPVIVYIHGGAFIVGSGSVPIYDGEAMSKKGVVFVTINYRLGVLGFFAHPELTKESPHHSSGNYGLLDQVAALKWIKNNIANFGGDPNNVTIAGQSAGSISVNALDVSPLSKGLFHKMIAESGGNVMKGGFGSATTLDSAERKGMQFAEKAGASNLEALRKIDGGTLLNAFSGVGAVIVDGYMLTEPVSATFAKGKQYDMPLLTGFNADEELDFGFQNFAWAVKQSEKKSKAYLYYFARKVPEFGGTNKYGAFHSGEVSYAYDNLKFFNRPLTEADYQLARVMSACWVNFAKTGNPNGAALPAWPAFRKDSGEVMIFDAESKAAKHPQIDGLNNFYKRAGSSSGSDNP